MADIAVRCTLRSNNSVVADDVINTFAVAGADPGVDDGDITDAFAEFYNVDTAGAGTSISDYIGATVMRTDGLVIDLVDSPGTIPNAPYYTEVYTLQAANDGGLPLEVSSCLSFQDAGYLTSAQPGRHRGRVYIGPLTIATMVEGDSATPAHPSGTWVDVMRLAAERLATSVSIAGRSWAIWSRADAAFREIVGGWVDNEYDTQRRRGHPATVRNNWTA